MTDTVPVHTDTLPAPLPTSRWDIAVATLGSALGISPDAVNAALIPSYAPDRSDATLDALADASIMTDADFRSAFPAVSHIARRRAVAAFRTSVLPTVNVTAPVTTPPPAPVAPVAAVPVSSVLLTPPFGDSLLNALRTGGRLNGSLTPEDVHYALTAYGYQLAGVYDLPEKIADAMVRESRAAQVPPSESFYKLYESLSARQYGDVLKVIGVRGTWVTDKSKREFIAGMRDTVIPAVNRLATAVKDFMTVQSAQYANPAMLMGAIAGAMGGTGFNPLAAGITMDVSGVRNAAEDVATAANRLFAEPHTLPTARAMAAEGTQIIGFLSPEYVIAAGFKTREMMLNTMGVHVSEATLRTEQAVERLVFNALRFPGLTDNDVARATTELAMMLSTLDVSSFYNYSDAPADGRKAFRDGRPAPKFSPYGTREG